MVKKKKNIPELRFPGFEGEWEEKKILNVLKIYYGKDQKEIVSENGKFPILGTGGEIGRTDSFLYDKPSVLIGRKGTIDKPVYLDSPFWTVDTLFYTKIFDNSHAKWLFYKFQMINWYLYNEASGVPSLSASTIYNITINLPTLPEQEKIASFLSSVDERIQQLSKKKSLLEQYKKGVMQQIFSEKLRFKDDKGNDFTDWEVKKIGEIAIKKSSQISANGIEENYGKFIIYGASGILKKIDFYVEEEDYVSIVKDGAGVGRLLYCKGKSSVLGTMDIIKPFNQKINTFFLYYILNNIDFVKYITGSTIPHIYFKDYSNENCKVPSLPEQEKISSFLSSIDKKIELVNTQLIKTKTWKKGLLQKMFV